MHINVIVYFVLSLRRIILRYCLVCPVIVVNIGFINCRIGPGRLDHREFFGRLRAGSRVRYIKRTKSRTVWCSILFGMNISNEFLCVSSEYNASMVCLRTKRTMMTNWRLLPKHHPVVCRWSHHAALDFCSERSRSNLLRFISMWVRRAGPIARTSPTMGHNSSYVAELWRV